MDCPFALRPVLPGSRLCDQPGQFQKHLVQFTSEK
ncbi:Protein of unknown function [Lactobacillus equicursoris DSM 19284 = JCM 14600 = CIP 110162]|nr:Protein of unknown function [Lactobacillus equicursoris DSM 19284 = JCM 14600 = CIP 110162]